jgi:hypothetical protein
MHLDRVLQGVRAVQKHGRSITSAAKDFQIPLHHTLARHCKRVREVDMKSTSPTLLLNTGYIQHI